MTRAIAPFALLLTASALGFVACRSLGADPSDPTNETDAGSTVAPPSPAGDDSSDESIYEELGTGPRPFGTVPPPPPVAYTCLGEIHVATTGDDDANDGSEAKPYRTIAKAAPLAKPGDCVKVHAGTYAESTTITFGMDGTADKPIVLYSADGRGAAIIDSATNTTGPAIEVKHDHVVIDGFVLQNLPTAENQHVVRFDGMNAGKCVGSVLRNCKITGGFQQLKIYQKTQGVLVEHNELYGKSTLAPLSLTGANGLVFRANYCHDWDSGDFGSAQLAGGSTDVLFEKNLFQDVATAAGAVALGDGCGATCDHDPEHYAAVNARAINNLFIRAVRAFDILGCKNCSVLSNTIIDSGRSVVFRLGWATTNGHDRASTGTRILNNLIGNGTVPMGYVMLVEEGAAGGLQMDYNLFWNGPRGVAFHASHPASADRHSIQAAPLLAGPTDFRPRPGSAAIRAGMNLNPEVKDDFLSAARPANGALDIGAFQH
jgi:hypothetical protein